MPYQVRVLLHLYIGEDIDSDQPLQDASSDSAVSASDPASVGTDHESSTSEPPLKQREYPANKSPATTAATASTTRRTQEEFSSTELEKLLTAVIEVDPFMCKHGKSDEKWKEVLDVVQSKGFCKNRTPGSIKNKVLSEIKHFEVCFFFCSCSASYHCYRTSSRLTQTWHLAKS